MLPIFLSHWCARDRIRPLVLAFFVLSSFTFAQTPKQDDPFAKAGFSEDAMQMPKALPDAKNLKYFTPSADSKLKFAVDSKSLNIGKDGAIRYIVVIENPSGTKQIKYEGIRCETFEYKIFATLDEKNEWKPLVNSEWKRIPNLGYNQYQATLGRGGFCAGESANSNFTQIFETLR